MPARDPAPSSSCSRLPPPELHVCAQVCMCACTGAFLLQHSLPNPACRSGSPGQRCRPADLQGVAPGPSPQGDPSPAPGRPHSPLRRTRPLTFVLRLLLLLVHLGIVPGVHLLLQGLQFALVVLGTEARLWLHAETSRLWPSPPDTAPPGQLRRLSEGLGERGPGVGAPHQPLLLQQVGGLLALPAVLVLQLLEPVRAPGECGRRVRAAGPGGAASPTSAPSLASCRCPASPAARAGRRPSPRARPASLRRACARAPDAPAQGG